MYRASSLHGDTRTYAVCMVGTLVNATNRHFPQRNLAIAPRGDKRPLAQRDSGAGGGLRRMSVRRSDKAAAPAGILPRASVGFGARPG